MAMPWLSKVSPDWEPLAQPDLKTFLQPFARRLGVVGKKAAELWELWDCADGMTTCFLGFWFLVFGSWFLVIGMLSLYAWTPALQIKIKKVHGELLCPDPDPKMLKIQGPSCKNQSPTYHEQSFIVSLVLVQRTCETLRFLVSPVLVPFHYLLY